MNVDQAGIAVLFPQAITDGTGTDAQGTLSGGPRGFTLIGWRYFHD